MRKVFFFLFLIVSTVFVFASRQEGEQKLITVQLANFDDQIIDTFERSGFDIAGHYKGKLEVVVDSDAEYQEFFRFLRKKGIAFEIISLEESHAYGQSDSAEYFSVEETLQAMRDMESANPQIVKVFDLNEKLETPKTQGGQSLYAMQISLRPSEVIDQAKILFVGQHHARELMTHHAVIDSAKLYLERINAADPKYTDALQKHALWFVPVVNPDGLDYVFSRNNMWRKNRAQNDDGSRGVDLNRNYAYKWGECGSNSSRGSSDTYKGPSAFSEPESLVMDGLVSLIRPQFLISYHSSGDEVLYPYVCGQMAERDVYYGIRDELASELGFGKRVASSSGEDFEHHYARYGSLAFLLEIGRSFQPSFSTYLRTVKPTIEKVLPFLLDKLSGGWLEVKVLDADSGEPLQAGVMVSDIRFVEGETRYTDKFGTYRWLLKPGAYELTVARDGYFVETQQVEVGAGRSMARMILRKKD